MYYRIKISANKRMIIILMLPSPGHRRKDITFLWLINRDDWKFSLTYTWTILISVLRLTFIVALWVGIISWMVSSAHWHINITSHSPNISVTVLARAKLYEGSDKWRCALATINYTIVATCKWAISTPLSAYLMLPFAQLCSTLL